MASVCFVSTCLCLTCKTSNCVFSMPKISILKSSEWLSISVLIMPLLGGLLPLVMESVGRFVS